MEYCNHGKGYLSSCIYLYLTRANVQIIATKILINRLSALLHFRTDLCHEQFCSYYKADFATSSDTGFYIYKRGGRVA